MSDRSTERWVMLVAVLATTMAFVDATALNVALPAIQEGLGASGSQLLWIVNAYGVPLTAFLLIAGSLGDRIGRRRVFRSGIWVFAIASLACGICPSPVTLIAARAVQGMGAAMMIPGSLALITAVFPAERLGKAIGTWSAFTVITMAAGPVLGGLLADWGLWRFVFFINLPIAAVCLWLLTHLPRSLDERVAGNTDVAGALASVVGLAALSYALIEASQRGWNDPRIIGLLALGIVSLVLLIVIEARSVHPMLPLQIFRSTTFSAANVMTILLYTAFHAVMLFVPLNLVQAQGYGADMAGLAQLPVMLAVIIASPLVGIFVDRFGARWPLVIGQAISGVGLWLLAAPELTEPSQYWTQFLPPLALLGIGMGLSIAPLSTTVMNSIVADHSGLASGINSMLSRLANVLAVAILGGIALCAFRDSLIDRTSEMAVVDRQAVIAESQQLGAAQPPSHLEPDERDAVERSIRLAFVDSFRVLCRVSAGLAWLGSSIALVLIRSGDKDKG